MHSLSSGVDEGPIICQAVTSVTNFDTKETLEKKVLALEHFIFPLSIGAVLSGKVIQRETNGVILKVASPGSRRV